MSVLFSPTQFTVAAHGSVSLQAAFNGSAQTGGDQVGPVVACPLPTKLNESVNVTTTSIKFLRRNSDGLTSKTIYLFRVSNPNGFHVTFTVQYLID